VVALAATTSVWAGQWVAVGPDGGDVRSLSYDPKNPDHIFLGTNTGTLFTSEDGGHSWSRFAHLGSGDDYVLDHIAVDSENPKHIFVAAWSVDNQQAGDLFRSTDGGKTWDALPGMHGKSIRAMAIAASDHKTIVTGALDGVYRSTDAGNSWQKISTSSQNEIKNIESIAVDPKDPNVVYAGTWHLAWKTSDGGANWSHINKGMIDDSDVFSIIVDSSNPSVVFASACSGIYRSATGGDLFSKIQGIPFSARRTRVLKQDASNPNTVYAGTTEGLWKTLDSGKTWKRVSNPEVVVNDVIVDPRNSNRVLIATDRSGVMASDDGAQTFVASNHGYTIATSPPFWRTRKIRTRSWSAWSMTASGAEYSARRMVVSTGRRRAQVSAAAMYSLCSKPPLVRCLPVPTAASSPWSQTPASGSRSTQLSTRRSQAGSF